MFNGLVVLAAATMCPEPGQIAAGQRFHNDAVCNRPAYNKYKSNLGRHARVAAFKSEPSSYARVPNRKTSYCPVDSSSSDNDQEQTTTPATGLDTVWIVENTASSAVRIYHINKDGREVSALSPSVDNDPKSILEPGQWMAVNTFEGHKFGAREIAEDGGAGRVLLEHTVGLIPVGAGHEVHDCPLIDTEPVFEDKFDQHFARTPSAVNRPCNTVDVGFRNMAGCPLHAYYVMPSQEEQVACTEEFKFHLGTNSATPDFSRDWSAPTKFEGTYTGHTFHFRLAHTGEFVQRVTLEPTQVTDCPDKIAATVSLPVGMEGEPVPGGTGMAEEIVPPDAVPPQEVPQLYAAMGASVPK